MLPDSNFPAGKEAPHEIKKYANTAFHPEQKWVKGGLILDILIP